MSEFAIEVEGGKSVRLKTEGKYCDRNIVVTATGGGGDTDAAYQQGVTDGKQAEYDRFWDAYQNNGEYENWMHYAYAFAGRGWTDEVYNPKYPISFGGGYSAQYMFAFSRITDTKVPITVNNGGDKTITNPFANSLLETIRKFVIKRTDGLGVGEFTGCTALKNITIEGVLSGRSGRTDPNFQWSPLTKASIKNVIACLSDTSVEVTATFQKTAVNAAFSTDEWNALVASKPNWTITLA